VGTRLSEKTVDGILNLNKPKGWTSHDVVAHVRRLTRIRRVGHAGTLDPLATGVLLICLGRATRIAEYLVAGRKRYRADLHLGVSTDSHDADGRMTATTHVSVDRGQVEAALAGFRGNIKQVPPMVSAIKQQGQPLYKLAREGIMVDRPARPIEIYELTLTDWHPPVVTIELTCSSGTYVRALARDLGDVLDCGAHVSTLTRLSSGAFDLSDAIELEEFTAAVATGEHEQRNAPGWQRLVIPMDAGLQHFPACILGASESRRVRSGQPIPAELVSESGEQICRAYTLSNSKKILLALLRFDDDAQLWRPHKVFHPL
jgi:tRNA pseudouridine55 synthase